MTNWIFVPVILFVLVILFTRVANKQARSRKTRNFKTNYQNKKKHKNDPT
jgi:hypothetical protein